MDAPSHQVRSLKTTTREEARTARRREAISAMEKDPQIHQAPEESAETRLELNKPEKKRQKQSREIT